jgi:hypothetical protein
MWIFGDKFCGSADCITFYDLKIYKNPFSHSVWANITSVMGSNPLLWLVRWLNFLFLSPASIIKGIVTILIE